MLETQLIDEIKTEKSIQKLIEEQKFQIKKALPKNIPLNYERLMRICLTEFREPAISKCTPLSLLGAVIKCSQLGLEPGSTLGHVYLVPYGKECQVMIGYRGMMHLARRSGKLKSLVAHVVKRDDIFEYQLGLNENLMHKPSINDNSDIVAVYAIAHLIDGTYQIEVMSIDDVNRIKQRSKSGGKGPWATDFEEMARKTVIRRLFKYLPISTEIQEAVGLDEQSERGEQHNANVFENMADIEVQEEEVKITKTEKLLNELKDEI